MSKYRIGQNLCLCTVFNWFMSLIFPNNQNVMLSAYSWSMMFVDEPNSGVVILIDFLSFLQSDNTERPKKKKYEILYKDGVSHTAIMTFHSLLFLI